MLLLVTLHSVAIAVYLFEWITNRFRDGKKKTEYGFEFVDPTDSSKKVDKKYYKI